MKLPSKVLILQTTAGNHLGFIMLAPDQTEASGDCIFMLLPKDKALWDTEEFSWLCRRDQKEAGEHRFALCSDGSMRISADGFELTLCPSGEGHLVPSQRPVGLRAIWKTAL